MTLTEQQVEELKDFAQSCLNFGRPPECRWPRDEPKPADHDHWCQACRIMALLPDRYLRLRDEAAGESPRAQQWRMAQQEQK